MKCILNRLCNNNLRIEIDASLVDSLRMFSYNGVENKFNFIIIKEIKESFNLQILK